MKKISLIGLVIFVTLAACAHEASAPKTVAEEKIELAPDPPAPIASADEEETEDAETPPDDSVIDAGTKEPY